MEKIDIQEVRGKFELMYNNRIDKDKGLTIQEGILLMFDFYNTYKVGNASSDDDTDMLLFQWGNYDGVSGEKFELNLTRQIIVETDGYDSDMYQLSLTYYFESSGELNSMESGDLWSDDFDIVEDFINYIRDNEVTQITQNTQMLNVNLEFEQV